MVVEVQARPLPPPGQVQQLRVSNRTQSTQMVVEVQAHPLPPPGQAQQLRVSNRTQSTQMVVEVQAHSPPPGQTLGNNRTFVIEI